LQAFKTRHVRCVADIITNPVMVELGNSKGRLKLLYISFQTDRCFFQFNIVSTVIYKVGNQTHFRIKIKIPLYRFRGLSLCCRLRQSYLFLQLVQCHCPLPLYFSPSFSFSVCVPLAFPRCYHCQVYHNL